MEVSDTLLTRAKRTRLSDLDAIRSRTPVCSHREFELAHVLKGPPDHSLRLSHPDLVPTLKRRNCSRFHLYHNDDESTNSTPVTGGHVSSFDRCRRHWMSTSTSTDRTGWDPVSRGNSSTVFWTDSVVNLQAPPPVSENPLLREEESDFGLGENDVSIFPVSFLRPRPPLLGTSLRTEVLEAK